MTRSRPQKRTRAAVDGAAASTGTSKAARHSLEHTQATEQRAALVDISNQRIDRTTDLTLKHTAKATTTDVDKLNKVVTRSQGLVGKENAVQEMEEGAITRRRSASLSNHSTSRSTTSTRSTHSTSNDESELTISPVNEDARAQQTRQQQKNEGEEEEEEEEEMEDEDDEEDSEDVYDNEDAIHDEEEDEEEEEEEEDLMDEIFNHAIRVQAARSEQPTRPVETSTTTQDQHSTAALSSTATATSPSSVLSAPSEPSTQPSRLSVDPESTASSSADVIASVSRWKESLRAASAGSSGPYDYSPAVLQNLRDSELVSLPSPSYMDDVQGDLSFPMRSILLDWLVEVASEYHLHAQTIFLTVSYVDRFLCQAPIDRRRLQLVGITCMLIAAKYWEIYPPTVEDFVYISDHTYAREQVLDMERAVLTQLRFQLTIPTAWEFGRRLAKDLDLEPIEVSMMDFLCEAFAQEPAYLQHPPSKVAASAAYLSMSTYPFIPASRQQHGGAVQRKRAGGLMKLIQRSSGYVYRDLKACITAMHRMHERIYHDPQGNVEAGNTGFKAVVDKYTTYRQHGVTQLPPRESIAEIL